MKKRFKIRNEIDIQGPLLDLAIRSKQIIY